MSIMKSAESDFIEIDNQLYKMGISLNLLSRISPKEDNAEKEAFLKAYESGQIYNPQFSYGRIKIDLDERKQLLGNLQISTKNPLGLVLEGKRRDLLNKIALIESIGHTNFTLCSIQLYGKPSLGLVDKAYIFLQEHQLVQLEKKTLDASQAKKELEGYLQEHGFDEWTVVFKSQTEVLKNRRKVALKADAMYSQQEIERLKIHEIGCHVLRAENARKQKYKVFLSGFPGYTMTEEGLAATLEERAGCLDLHQIRIYAGRTIAVNKALGSSFDEVFEELVSLGFDCGTAYVIARRVKRGLVDTSLPGGLTKDYVYFAGKYLVGDYLKSGGALDDLLGYGKIGVGDVEIVKKIAAQGGL